MSSPQGWELSHNQPNNNHLRKKETWAGSYDRRTILKTVEKQRKTRKPQAEEARVASHLSLKKDKSMRVRNSDYPLCRHTKTDGLQCQSPALTTSAFCYHHQKLRRTRMSTISSGPGLSTRVLHPLRNADSIQQAFAMVFSALAANRIHPKVAGRMLYGLQLAASNLRKASLK